MDMAAVSMDMHTMQIASQASVSVLKNTMDMAEEIFQPADRSAPQPQCGDGCAQ